MRVGKGVEKVEIAHADGNVTQYNCCGKVWLVPQKFGHKIVI